MRRMASIALTALVVLGVTAGSAGAKKSGNTPPGDPPGNNGTIKVVASEQSDPDPGNEPQIDGCRVWVEFYGFDEGQTVDIAFNAQPPTGKGEELLVSHSEVISTTPAGGGQDKDATLSFDLASALVGFEPQSQQGYHVKLTSNTEGAPGGAKQKVFWLNCTPAPPGTLTINKSVQGDRDGAEPFGLSLLCSHSPLDGEFALNAGENRAIANVPAGTVCEVTEPEARGARETWVKETPADGTPDGKFKVGQGNMTIDLTNVFTPAGVEGSTAGQAGGTAQRPPDVGVLGVTLSAPEQPPGPQVIGDTLPRTGGGPWAAIALGSWGIAAGAVARRAGRRRSARC